MAFLIKVFEQKSFNLLTHFIKFWTPINFFLNIFEGNPEIGSKSIKFYLFIVDWKNWPKIPKFVPLWKNENCPKLFYNAFSLKNSMAIQNFVAQ
jgi:hypothetical protein